MAAYDAPLADAFARYQSGDLAGAGAIARRLLGEGHEDARLSALAGMVAIQSGDAAEAARHLRPALAATPDNLPLRTNLAFALVQTGRLDEAKAVATKGSGPQLRRIVAFVDQQQGRDRAAIQGYRQVLAGFPQDYESWSNLGLLLSRHGETAEAEAALRRSLALRADQREPYVHLDLLLDRLGRHGERRGLLREAVRHVPDDADLLVALGLAEGMMDDFATAEAAYATALRIAPEHRAAHLEYGMLLERLNRLDDLDRLILEARARDIGGAEIDFIAAWAARRAGRFADARLLAEHIGAGIDPGRLAQLHGEIADACGDADAAFAAFTAMNAASAATPASARARALDFPGEVSATIRRLAPASVARWTEAPAANGPPAPTFIVGFPRSGTTLLDTLLINAPELHVLEEVPVVERLEALLGEPDGIASLSAARMSELRAAYFSIQQQLAPKRNGEQRIIDKFPINMVRVPLIHRLFPDAKFVLVERHPCDAVLSCFMARFQINRAMVQFQDLAAAARLYDLAFQAWHRAIETLPVTVHTVRYERLVADLEPELRRLLGFIDIEWRPEMLDNQRAARERRHIATPSYSQVTQPIHARAIGRWTRYRDHLAPVMPILMPWIERMGYTA